MVSRAGTGLMSHESRDNHAHAHRILHACCQSDTLLFRVSHQFCIGKLYSHLVTSPISLHSAKKWLIPIPTSLCTSLCFARTTSPTSVAALAPPAPVPHQTPNNPPTPTYTQVSTSVTVPPPVPPCPGATTTWQLCPSAVSSTIPGYPRYCLCALPSHNPIALHPIRRHPFRRLEFGQLIFRCCHTHILL